MLVSLNTTLYRSQQDACLEGVLLLNTFRMVLEYYYRQPRGLGELHALAISLPCMHR